jgi:uncharacterized membrane protein YedE/YeeE
VSRRALIALAAGSLFGAGLTVSGMVDPGRVRGFLDIAGTWDPTLAFVMIGAILPMALAWWLASRRERPVAADRFHLPNTSPVDLRLIAGAALFGVGWGIAGLCPGPAIADLVLRPAEAGVFVLSLIAGFALHHGLLAGGDRRPSPRPVHEVSP